MGTCGGGVQPRTTQDLNLEKMLLLASILLLGCASAFAAGHGNAMGCCEVKRVSGSGPFSGSYYLDTDYSKAVPVSCKDSCVYMASGPKRYCFKPSSTYKSECQDRSASTGPTTYPSPANCNELKSDMTALENALLDINAPDFPDLAFNIFTMLKNLVASTLSPGCSSTDFKDLIDAKNAAGDNAKALVQTQTNLTRDQKAELHVLARNLTSLLDELTEHLTDATTPLTNPCGSGGGAGMLSYLECNGKPNGTPCSKLCTAPDCRQSACCDGCCRRGNTLDITDGCFRPTTTSSTSSTPP